MKKMKWIIAALAACALALAATGCDDGFTEAALNAMQNNAEQESGTPKPNTCEHYYDENKCTKCGLKRPSLPGGSINNYGVLMKYTGNAAIVDIPDGVTKIYGAAFYNNKSLEHVTIPGSVESIGNSNDWTGAFENCTNLKSVTIGEGVTSIGSRAFSGCTSLTSVEIPDSVESIESSAFWGCSNLKVHYTGTLADWCAEDWLYEVMSRATTVTVGEDERDLKGMTELVIPDGVKSIGQYAFYRCAGLTSVTIGEGVTSIGEYAFFLCTSLESVTIPDGVKSIGQYAFYRCAGLTSVTIPDSVTSIGQYAFYGCTSLASVTIPASVTSIRQYAFYGCTSLASVEIPASVTSIGEYVFRGCTSLTDVTYKGTLAQWCALSNDDGLMSYAKHVTVEGTDLKQVTTLAIPDGVTSIESSAFYGCTSLASVTIPASVTSIGEYAFRGCTSLASVTIGNGVKSIGDSAFSRCTSLATINYTGTEEQWNAITKGSYWDSGTGNYTITYNYTE